MENSGAMESVKYVLTDPSSGTGTLKVKFKRKPQMRPSIAPANPMSTTYEYYGVPEETYLELVGSKTPGSFFVTDIRNRFETKRLTESEALAMERDDAVDHMLRNRPPVQVPTVTDDEIEEVINRDETLASAGGRRMTAQVNAPSDQDNSMGKVEENANRRFAERMPYRNAQWWIALTEIQDGWSTKIVRYEPGTWTPADATVNKRYAMRGAAIRRLLDEIKRALRVNKTTPNHEIARQYLTNGTYRHGGNDYSVRLATMREGDMAWVIEKREEGEPQPMGVDIEHPSIVKGLAFSYLDDAIVYASSPEFLGPASPSASPAAPAIDDDIEVPEFEGDDFDITSV